jgi:hypothetical protein
MDGLKGREGGRNVTPPAASPGVPPEKIHMIQHPVDYITAFIILLIIAV